jgi:hypothetical protein
LRARKATSAYRKLSLHAADLAQFDPAMDLTERLNKLASDKQLSGRSATIVALAALVLLDKNNEVVIDPDDLTGTIGRLRAAASANGVADIEGSGVPSAGVLASLTTNLTGANNDLVFTAVPAGAAGNRISVEYVNPGANNQALHVVINGTAIRIFLATGVAGAITTTAAQIAALTDFAALVTVANKAANDGTGVVTAMTGTPLAGGVDIPGIGVAGKGSRYTDYTNGELYINTGTAAAPVWKKVTHA